MTNTALLGDVAELRAGVGFPQALQGRTNGDYPLAKVGDLSRHARGGETVVAQADHYVDEADLARLRARPFPAGSVLFAKIGEAIRQNHRLVAGRPLLLDNNAMGAVPGDQVLSSYLFRYLQTVDFYSLASKTTVPALRKSDLERITLPLPSLDEQRRIADVLDGADALRAKRRETLAHLGELTQAIFADMFGADRSLPRALGEILLRIDSGKSPTCRDRPAALSESGVLKLGAVSFGRYREGENKATLASSDVRAADEVAGGDVLLSRKNTPGLVGASVYVGATRPGLYLPDLIFRLVPDPAVGVRPRYLRDALATPKVRNAIRSLAGGSAASMVNISKAKLATVTIPVPDTDEQDRYIDRASAVDGQRTRVQRDLAYLDALFASLQQRAFRGDLFDSPLPAELSDAVA